MELVPTRCSIKCWQCCGLIHQTLPEGQHLHKAHQLHPQLPINGTQTTTNLLRMYVFCKRIRDALIIFTTLNKSSTFPWNWIIRAFGVNGHCRYGIDLAKQLAASLHNVMSSCGTVRISFSRRTPPNVSDIILKQLGDHPKIQTHIWVIFAWGDAFIITSDSVSMLSEACSTGKPVYVIGAERCRWKFASFHKDLQKRGLVRHFTGLEDISNSWSYPPLNDDVDAAGDLLYQSPG